MKPSKKGFILVAMLMVGFLTFVAATTTISDLKVESPFGKYLIVQTPIIDVPGTPLVFTDSANLTAYAVFNGPSNMSFSQIDGITGNLAFPKGTTSFLGDVSNFDDIDGQSRFKETNINNGTSASAAFVAENDVGFTTAFGIGGSNFGFANQSFNSEAAIFHNAPTKFNFANAANFGWDWRANNLPFGTGFNFTESMQLSGEGNLNIAGNFTGDQFYGEMFGIHINTPEIIVIDQIAIINSSGIFNTFQITGFEKGMGNGITFFNNTLIVDVAGLYIIQFGITYSDAAQSRHGFTVNLNGVPIRKISGSGYLANANDIRSVSATGFQTLEVGDVLELVVGDRIAPATNIEVAISELNLLRIGD